MGSRWRSLFSLMMLLVLLITAYPIPIDQDHDRPVGSDPVGTSPSNDRVGPDHSVPPNRFDWRVDLGGNVNDLRIGPDGNIYASCENDYLRCMDPEGNELWKVWDCSLIDFFSNGDPLCVIGNGFSRIDPTDGAIIWEDNEHYTGKDRLFFRDHLLVMDNRDRMYCIDGNGDEIWSMEHMRTHYDNPYKSGGSHNTYSAWDEMHRFLEPSPDGLIYYTSSRNEYSRLQTYNLTAIDMDGNILFNHTFGSYINEIHHLDDGNTLVITSPGYYEANSTVMKIDRQGEILWKKTVSNTEWFEFNEIKEEVHFFPSYYWQEGGMEPDNTMTIIDIDGGVFQKDINMDIVYSYPSYYPMVEGYLITAGNERDGMNLTLLGNDLKEVWTRNLSTNKRSPFDVHLNGNIYFANDIGQLVCLDKKGSCIYNVSMPFKQEYERYYHLNTLHFEMQMDYEGNAYVGTTRIFKISPEGEILWEKQIGGLLFTTPTVDSTGTTFIASHDMNLYSISKDGAILWNTTLPGIHDMEVFLSSDEERLIIPLNYHGLYCYNRKGELEWNLTLNGTIKEEPSLLEDDSIVVGTYNDWLYMIDIEGNIVWELDLPGDPSARAGVSPNGTIYLVADNHLISMNKDGSINWNVGEEEMWLHSNPVVNQRGEIVVGGDLLYGFDQAGNILWSSDHDYNHGMDYLTLAPDGSIIGEDIDCISCYWPNGTYRWMRPTYYDGVKPIVDDQGIIYTDNKGIVAYSLEGDIIWAYRCPLWYRSHGEHRSYPVVLEDRIVFINGALYSISWDETSDGIEPPPPIAVHLQSPNYHVMSYEETVNGYPMQGVRIYRAIEDGEFEFYFLKEPYGGNFGFPDKITWEQTEYYYAVAYNQHYSSEPSRITNSTMMWRGNPSPPQNFTSKWVKEGLLLSWDPPRLEGAGPILGYKILWSFDDSSYHEIAYVPPENHSYIVSNLTLDRAYFFKVGADNIEGWTNTEIRWTVGDNDDDTEVYDSGDDIRICGSLGGILVLIIIAAYFILRKRDDRAKWFDGKDDEHGDGKNDL